MRQRTLEEYRYLYRPIVRALFLDRALDQFYQANLIARVDYADILYIAPIMFAVGVTMAAITAYVTLRLYVRK